MNNRFLEENFKNGEIAIHVTDENQCQQVVNYVNVLGYNVDELDHKTYLEYPYFFIEQKEQLQATKTQESAEFQGCKVIKFTDIF